MENTLTTYIITFEVNDKDRRSLLKEKIRTFGSYCPIHNNAWAIRTEKKARDVRDFLTPFLTKEDRIFVIRTGTEAAWKNPYGSAHSEWLKKYL